MWQRSHNFDRQCTDREVKWKMLNYTGCRYTHQTWHPLPPRNKILELVHQFYFMTFVRTNCKQKTAQKTAHKSSAVQQTAGKAENMENTTQGTSYIKISTRQHSAQHRTAKYHDGPRRKGTHLGEILLSSGAFVWNPFALKIVFPKPSILWSVWMPTSGNSWSKRRPKTNSKEVYQRIKDNNNRVQKKKANILFQEAIWYVVSMACSLKEMYFWTCLGYQSWVKPQVQKRYLQNTFLEFVHSSCPAA